MLGISLKFIRERCLWSSGFILSSVHRGSHWHMAFNLHHWCDKERTRVRWPHLIRILRPSSVCITASCQSSRLAEDWTGVDWRRAHFEEWQALWWRSAEQDSCFHSSYPASRSHPQWLLTSKSNKTRTWTTEWIPGGVFGPQVTNDNIVVSSYFCQTSYIVTFLLRSLN